MFLNVHVHALVIDGVFAKDRVGVRFHPTPALTAAGVADVLGRPQHVVAHPFEALALTRRNEDARMKIEAFWRAWAAALVPSKEMLQRERVV